MRALHASAHTATWIVVFACALVAGAAIHLGQPAARRLVAAGVNSTLEPILQGRVVVDRVGALGLTSLDDVDAHVDGPDGKAVIRVQGVHARISTWGLVRRLFGGRRQIAIDVPEASVSKVEVALDSDATGEMRIVRAFVSRTPSAPDEPPGPELRLHLRHVRIAHAVVRFEPTTPIDGDVDDVEGSLRIEGGMVTVDATRATVAVRGLPGDLDARGAVSVHLTTPELKTRVHWDGAVRAIRQTADVLYDDGHVDASADFASTTPGDVKSVWAGCTFSNPRRSTPRCMGGCPTSISWPTLAWGRATPASPARIDLEATKHALLQVRAHALDIAALAPSGPASDLSASGHVTLEADPSWALDGQVAVESEEGTIARVRVPPSTIEGDVHLPPGGLPTAKAEIRLEEAGAPTAVSVRVAPKRGALVVTFDADVNVPRLEAIARVPTFATGRAHVSTSGTLDFGARYVSGRISADVSSVAIGDFALERGHVDARVAGPLKAPAADVDSEGSGVTAVRCTCRRSTSREGSPSSPPPPRRSSTSRARRSRLAAGFPRASARPS